MASRLQSLVVLFVITLASFMISASEAILTRDFYRKVCPKALPIIRSIVQRAISREPRVGASLLRLHFHDCFVNVNYATNIFECFLFLDINYDIQQYFKL